MPLDSSLLRKSFSDPGEPASYEHNIDLDPAALEQLTKNLSNGMSNRVGESWLDQRFGVSPQDQRFGACTNALENFAKQEKRKSTADIPSRTDLTILAVVSIVFIILFTMQNVLVKYQNQVLDITLPWLTALTLTIGWPLNGLILLYYNGFERMNMLWIIKRYGFLGFLDALHLSLLSFGLNNLPGSTYTLLKGSSVIWTAVLSRIILRKPIPFLHYVSVIIMCASTVVVSGLSGIDHADEENDPNRWLWIACALASAAANAFQIVIAQYLFDIKSERKSMQVVAEASFFNGLFSFLFLLLPVAVSQEHLFWISTFSMSSQSGFLELFILSILGIGISKQLGYFTKFAAVSHSTALYAGVLDTVRRAVVVIAVVLLFNEKFDWQKGIATALTFVGFGVYLFGSHLKRVKADQRFQNVLNGVNVGYENILVVGQDASENPKESFGSISSTDSSAGKLP